MAMDWRNSWGPNSDEFRMCFTMQKPNNPLACLSRFERLVLYGVLSTRAWAQPERGAATEEVETQR